MSLAEPKLPPVGISHTERCYLSPEKDIRYTGFAANQRNARASRRERTRDIDHETRHWVRTSRDDAPDYYPSIEYHMWKEAGKLPADTPERDEPNYNANLWRNFTALYGGEDEEEPTTSRINKRLAAMYPVSVPKASLLGDRTYGRMLQHAPSIIKDDHQRNLVVDQTMMDVNEFRRLRLADDMRNPPIDKRGKLLPPPNYKKYPPIELNGVRPEAERNVSKIDLFGQPIYKTHPYYKNVLSYKVNNPVYDRVYRKMRQMHDQYVARQLSQLHTQVAPQHRKA